MMKEFGRLEQWRGETSAGWSPVIHLFVTEHHECVADLRLLGHTMNAQDEFLLLSGHIGR